MAPIATRLILNTKAFTKGIKTATKGIGALGGALGKVGGTVAKFGLAIAGVTAGLAAVLLRSAAYIDRLGKVSKTTGIATDTLQKFGFAAEQAGITSDNAALALRRFSRRLGEAQKGSGELLPALRRLGIDVKDAGGNFKTAEQVLFEFADGIKNTEGASAKLALAFKAFDSEGAELVGTLEDGAEGLKKMFDRAQALGIVLDNKTIAGVEKFSDSLNELKRMMGGVINRLTGALAPALDEIVKYFTDVILKTAEAQGGFEEFGKYLKDQLLTVFQSVGRAFFEVYKVITMIINGIITGLQKLGVINELQELQSTIKDLREESQKDFFDREQFKILIGAYSELNDEFGNFEYFNEADYKKAISILERKAKELEASGDTGINLIKVPDEEDFMKYFEFLEKFKEKSIEAQGAIAEIVTTGVKTQQNAFEKMLDSIFGVDRMDKFFGSSEKYAEDAVSNIGEFISVTFELMGKNIVEFFESVREGLDAAGIGDFTKTLQEGFIKAGQLLEDALTDAVLTGKLSFSSLADHIKKVLAKALIQKFITGPIMGLIPGLAEGGPATAGQPYVVGEEGPELFVPRGSGTVIPNDEMSSGGGGLGGATNVTYNIQATDAQSFQQLVARDPEFIYNVSRAGQRRQPA